jgi:subtilisin
MGQLRAVVRVLVTLVATATASAVAAPAVPATVPVPVPAAQGGVVPGSYIVTLKGGNADTIAREQAQREGATVDHVYRYALRGYSAHMSAAAAARVAADLRVASVVQDRTVSSSAQVLPPGINRVDADLSTAAAGSGGGAVDVDIAVIDTGIDPRHRDLNVVGGVNCVPGGLPFNDLNGHGTHVAGIAAAKDDKIGVVGVAPGARLWAVRVLTSEGAGTSSSVICGIDWVTAHASTIEVANMSLGGQAPEGSCTDGGQHEAICRSTAAGVTYVVAAGNSSADARSFAPANYDEVITVSAITDFDGKPGGIGKPTCAHGTDDTFTSYSNFGADVDLAAPGDCVLSTWLGGGYGTISGTSMASPHVAGAAALYRSTHPSASPADVKAALVARGTSDWTGDPDATKEPLLNVASL